MTALVAQVTVAELLRRRQALSLLTLLPLLFFVVRLDTPWTALRLLAIGLGWGVATLALFTHVSARSLDRRLVVAGARPLTLHLGRQLAVLAMGSVLALLYFAVTALTIRGDLTRLAPVLPLLLLTIAVAVPLGALIAALVPRDLEGALLLIAVMAVHVLVDPADDWTRILPMWSTRELAAYAVETVGSEYLARGLVHGVILVSVLVAFGWYVNRQRLKTHAVAAIATKSLTVQE